MADDENFSTDVRTCTTALTSYTLFPGDHNDDVCHLHTGINWWQRRTARPVASTRAAVSGTVLRQPRPSPGAAPVVDTAPDDTPFAPVTGTAIGISAYRIDQDGGCTATVCGDVPATPVLRLGRAAVRQVLPGAGLRGRRTSPTIAQNVVTDEIATGPHGPPAVRARRAARTTGTSSRAASGTLARPDHVRPEPRGSVSGLPGVKQFRKVSPAITGWRARTPRAPTSPSAGRTTSTTNQATPGWQGEIGQPVGRDVPRSRSTPSLRSPHRSSTRPRSTRRPTRRPTSSTPRARSTGGSRPSTAGASGCHGPAPPS